MSKEKIEKSYSIDISRLVEDDMMEFGVYSATGRHVPHVIDGLKPVQRRTIWKCSQSDAKDKLVKVMSISGLVATIHPHGSAGDAISAMVQGFPFANNYPLLSGKGTFGSEVVPDGVASERYVEARLSEFAKDVLLPGLAVSPMEESFDQSSMEPKFIESRLPLVLLNPSKAISVGFSVGIPGHSVREIVAAMEKEVRGEDYRWPEPYFKGWRGRHIWVRDDITDSGELEKGDGKNNESRGKVNSTGKKTTHLKKGGVDDVRGGGDLNSATDGVDGNGGGRKLYTSWGIERLDAVTWVVVGAPHDKTIDKLKERLAKIDDEQSIFSRVEDNSKKTFSVKLVFKKNAAPRSEEEVAAILGKPVNYRISYTVLWTDGSIRESTPREILREFIRHRRLVKAREIEAEIAKLDSEKGRLSELVRFIKEGWPAKASARKNRKVFVEELTVDGFSTAEWLADLPIYRTTKEEVEKLLAKIKGLDSRMSTLGKDLKNKASIDAALVREWRELADKYEGEADVVRHPLGGAEMSREWFSNHGKAASPRAQNVTEATFEKSGANIAGKSDKAKGSSGVVPSGLATASGSTKSDGGSNLNGISKSNAVKKSDENKFVPPKQVNGNKSKELSKKSGDGDKKTEKGNPKEKAVEFQKENGSGDGGKIVFGGGVKKNGESEAAGGGRIVFK
jgi:DNA gyrase subunit A